MFLTAFGPFTAHTGHTVSAALRAAAQVGAQIPVINSSELRAVKGHQKNDFTLNPINPPKQRAQTSRAAKGAKAQEVVYPAKQKWALDPEVDVDTRRVCEAS